MLWHERSYQQIDSLNRDTPVIIPLGSIEQHGSHLPLAVDTIQVTAVADRLENALHDEILVLPTLWLGSSEHHRDFAGTVSVPASLYSQVIKSIATSILQAGFRRIFFLNGHGGNETPTALALTELVAESDLADSAHLAMASWWQVGRDSMVPERHGMATPAITHACEYETSLMMAVRPDLVQLGLAAPSQPPIDTPWLNSEYGGRAKLFHRFHRLTGIGSMGDPTQATAEKGRSLLEAVVADCIAFIRDFSAWALLAPRREVASLRPAPREPL